MRKCLLEYGLWDEIRVNHGKEFYLMLYKLRKEGRGDAPYLQTSSTRGDAPYLQTSSTYNHGSRSTRGLMDDERTINMDSSTDK